MADTYAQGTQQETFLQRQKRLAGQQAQQSTQTAAQPPQPASAPAPQPTSQWTQPLTSPVGVNGQVAAPQPVAMPKPTAPATGMAAPPPSTTYQPLQGMNLGTTPYQAAQAPQVGTLPQAYAGSEFDQFSNPNQQETTGLQSNLMNAILRAPETMSPEAIAQLKEQQREQALLLGQQSQQGLAANAAARGVSGGGWAAGQQRAIEGDVSNQILSGNRAVDLAALEQNRKDQLNALGMSNELMSGEMSRAATGYGATLQGQAAQADDTRSSTQDNLQRALAQFGANLEGAQFNADEQNRAYTNDLNRMLSQFGINQGVTESGRADANLNLQGELGRGGLDLNNRQLTEDARQYDKGYGLDFMRYLENQRQFNGDTGYRYAALNQQGDQAMLDYITRMLK
jgi:hypothetical protein